jgi:hypothetical protein
MAALFRTLVDAFTHILAFSKLPLIIFVPSTALSPYLLRLNKHKLLPYASQLQDKLMEYLGEDIPSTTHHVRFVRYSTKWKHLPGRHLLSRTQDWMNETILPPLTVPGSISRKDEAYATWAVSFIPCHHPAWVSITPPCGNKVPPFVQGVLSSQNRHLFSACMQLTTCHCFDAAYSLHF